MQKKTLKLLNVPELETISKYLELSDDFPGKHHLVSISDSQGFPGLVDLLIEVDSDSYVEYLGKTCIKWDRYFQGMPSMESEKVSMSIEDIPTTVSYKTWELDIISGKLNIPERSMTSLIIYYSAKVSKEGVTLPRTLFQLDGPDLLILTRPAFVYDQFVEIRIKPSPEKPEINKIVVEKAKRNINLPPDIRVDTLVAEFEGGRKLFWDHLYPGTDCTEIIKLLNSIDNGKF